MSLSDDPLAVRSTTEWVDEDDDWEDEEWMFVVPWHVRFRLWLQFWKR